RHYLIPEDRTPFLEALVRGEYRRGRLIATCHQLEEEHRPGARDRQVPDLIDDQERGMREHLQSLRQSTGGLRLFQTRDQIRERAIVHTTATLRRCDGQTDGQVRLAHAGGTQQDHVLPTLYEAQLVQTLNLLSVDRRLE